MNWNFARHLLSAGPRLETDRDSRLARLPKAGLDVPKFLRAYVGYAEFRALVDSLSRAAEKKQLKSFAIVSEGSGEGKTFLAASLALAFALQRGQRVLVVDMTTFEQEGSLSLARLLDADASDLSVGAFMTTCEERIELVRVANLNADFGSSTELRVREFREGPAKDFDLVIFDTCALDARNRRNVDPAAVARGAGAAVLVASPLSQRRESVNSVRARLQGAEVPLLGVVANPILNPEKKS